MQKRWIYKPTPSPAEEVELLSNTINVNTHLSTVLWQRDIRDFESAKKFFRPSLRSSYTILFFLKTWIMQCSGSKRPLIEMKKF
jgi:hypothetical protein